MSQRLLNSKRRLRSRGRRFPKCLMTFARRRQHFRAEMMS